MHPLLTARLLVVTGKGGVGKTTISAALGLLAARAGERALIVDVGGGGRVGELFGAAGPRGARRGGGAVELAPLLWSTAVEPERALLDWLGSIGGRLPARVLGSRTSFRGFAAAAPGARELLSLVRVADLVEHGGYRTVILDAPATGHALALLRAPETFAAIARIGPVAAECEALRELLEDAGRTRYVAVAEGSEMAVGETLDLAEGLVRTVGRGPDVVLVNGVLARRFTSDELAALEGLDAGAWGAAALAAARFMHARARVQQSQISRLRRRGLTVVPVPLLFREQLDREALDAIASRLERGLATRSASALAAER